MLKKLPILVVTAIFFTGFAQELHVWSIPTNATLGQIPNIPADFVDLPKKISDKKIPLTSCFFNVLAGLEYLALSPYNGLTGTKSWSTTKYRNTKVTLKPEEKKGMIPVKAAMWGMVLCAQDLWVHSVKTEYSCKINQGNVRSTWTDWGNIDFTSTASRPAVLLDPLTGRPPDEIEVSRRALTTFLNEPSAINPTDIKITLSNIKRWEIIPPNFLFGFFTEAILASAATSDRVGGITFDKYESPIAEGYGLRITYTSAVAAQAASYELVVRTLAMLPGVMIGGYTLSTCEFDVHLKGKSTLKGRLELMN